MKRKILITDWKIKGLNKYSLSLCLVWMTEEPRMISSASITKTIERGAEFWWRTKGFTPHPGLASHCGRDRVLWWVRAVLTVQVREREGERKWRLGRGPLDCPWAGEWCVMVGWSALHSRLLHTQRNILRHTGTRQGDRYLGFCNFLHFTTIISTDRGVLLSTYIRYRLTLKSIFNH